MTSVFAFALPKFVAQWEASQGDDERIKAFVNPLVGEAWSEDAKDAAQSIRMFAGLDVGFKPTAVCVLGERGEVIWRGVVDTQPRMKFLRSSATCPIPARPRSAPILYRLGARSHRRMSRPAVLFREQLEAPQRAVFVAWPRNPR